MHLLSSSPVWDSADLASLPSDFKNEGVSALPTELTIDKRPVAVAKVESTMRSATSKSRVAAWNCNCRTVATGKGNRCLPGSAVYHELQRCDGICKDINVTKEELLLANGMLNRLLLKRLSKETPQRWHELDCVLIAELYQNV